MRVKILAVLTMLKAQKMLAAARIARACASRTESAHTADFMQDDLFSLKRNKAASYTNELKSWFLASPDIHIFETACIAQLIQVELLRHRFTVSNPRRRLCQIPNF